MSAAPEAALARVLHWVDQGPPRVLLALAGLPGSGKSTLAAALQAQVQALRGPQALQVLGMDGFHLTRAQLAARPDAAQALARRGAPWTFDPAGLRAGLQALRHAQAAVAWPGFDHGQGDPVPAALQVPTHTRVVLVEGLYLLHDAPDWQLAPLFDETWFLDRDWPQAQSQLCARHMQAWGLSQAAALARIAANDALNAQLVLADRARADWLVPA